MNMAEREGLAPANPALSTAGGLPLVVDTNPREGLNEWFRIRYIAPPRKPGEVLEWLIRPVSKTGKPQKGFEGSNPSLSAICSFGRNS